MYSVAASSFYDALPHDEGDDFSAALDFVVSADEVFDRYNNAPCGYHSLDAAGVFVRVNNTELHWLGYTRDAVLGQMRFTDLLTPASQTVFASLCADLSQGVTVHNTALELRRTDGSHFAVRLSAVPLQGDTGEYLGSRATLFDASGETLVKRTHTATPEVIYVYDVSMHRAVFASREATTEWGYTPGEITAMGDTLYERLIHPHDLAKVAAHIARVLAASDNSERVVSYRLRRADGTYRMFTSRDTVLARDEAGKVTQFLGVAHDLGEARETAPT